MAISKVIYGGDTLIDITDSTIDSNNMLQGTVGYNSAGVRTVGSAVIPTVNDSTITIKENGSPVDSFTLNQSSDKAIDIPVNQSYYGTCTDNGDVVAKTVTISNQNFKLAIGAVIGVRFSKSNSASNVTLNVNDTGNKSIYYNNYVFTGTSPNVCGFEDRINYYMYDGTYWVWLNTNRVIDTTYSTMAANEVYTGTETTAKIARADRLKTDVNKLIDDKINTLDGGTIGTPSESKTVTALSESNGNINATFGDIQIGESQVTNLTTDLNGKASSTHTHGNITSTGTITSDTTRGSGDKLVIIDANNNKVARSDISLSATVSSQSQTTKFLREDGGWSAPSYTSIPSNNVTGSGTSGYLTKFNGANTVTNGPKLGSATTTFLRNDGSWEVPPGTYSLQAATSNDLGGIKIGYSENGTNYAVKLSSQKAYVSVPWTNTTYTFAEGTTNGAFTVTPSTSGATAQSVPIHGLGSAAYTASTAYATSGHVHGSITNDGKINSDVTIANNDKLLIKDADDSNKIKTSSIAFNGQTATKCLTQKGTWEDFTSNTGTITKVTTSAGAHTAINISSGAVSFNVPTKTSHLTNDSGFLTAHQTIKQDGISGATVNRFGTCSTASGTAAKTVSITAGTFNLEAGSMITVIFTNENTANSPTLNVNSKGAKNIFANGEKITKGGNKSLIKGVVTFIYDGTQWHIISNNIIKSCIVGQSGNTTANPWFKFASFTATSVNGDWTALIAVENTYGAVSGDTIESTNCAGILRVRIRTGTNSGNPALPVPQYCEMRWLANTGYSGSDFLIARSPDDTTNPVYELWTKVAVGWQGRRFTILEEGAGRDSAYRQWLDLSSATYGTGSSAPTSGLTQTTSISSIIGVKGNAESTYRKGNVNLTAANIGALALTGGTTTGHITINRNDGKARVVDPTTGEVTQTATRGSSYIILGNNIPYSSTAASAAGNSVGYARFFGDGANYINLTTQNGTITANRTLYLPLAANNSTLAVTSDITNAVSTAIEDALNWKSKTIGFKGGFQEVCGKTEAREFVFDFYGLGTTGSVQIQCYTSLHLTIDMINGTEKTYRTGWYQSNGNGGKATLAVKIENNKVKVSFSEFFINTSDVPQGSCEVYYR